VRAVYSCDGNNGVYVVAINGRDAEVGRPGVGALMGTITLDSGTVVSTDPSWKCWNAPAHGADPPSGWEGANFDDSAWPQATTFGQNGQQDGEPNVPIWRRVKGSPIPDIADDAHWIWTPDNDAHNDIFCRVTVVESTAAAQCEDFSTTTTYDYNPVRHPPPRPIDIHPLPCVSFAVLPLPDPRR